MRASGKAGVLEGAVLLSSPLGKVLHRQKHECTIDALTKGEGDMFESFLAALEGSMGKAQSSDGSSFFDGPARGTAPRLAE